MFRPNQPKALCSGCGKQIATCADGTIFQHPRWTTMRAGGVSSHCEGSGKPPATGATAYQSPTRTPELDAQSEPTDRIGRCPECEGDYPLLSDDDLRAHIAPSGEYCPGSRGAPK